MSSHIEETVSDFLVTPSPSIADDNSTYDNFFGIMQQNPTNTNTNNSFATAEEFSQIHDTPAQPWRTLPQNIIYLIGNTKKVKTKTGGEGLILFLYAKDAITPLIHWSTSLLTSELLSLKDLSNVYVRSMGVKQSAGGRNYYAFQFHQKLR